MMDLNKFIKNLSKEQKEELLKLLNTEAMDSSTDKVIYCPKCGSFHLVKNGKAKGHQRFICQDCNQHFTEYRNTIFNLTKKNIQLWKSYIKMMFDGYTIKQIANELHICIQTSFRWRHKILSVLENKFMNDTLSGVVEVDETLILFSHKGQKIAGVKGRKRGGRATKRGQSNQQKGILVAIDRKKNVISEIYGEGANASYKWTRSSKELHKITSFKVLIENFTLEFLEIKKLAEKSRIKRHNIDLV